ncbi:MAG: cytochrome c, partial [Acidobacteriota bacterium]|nr:cytochrome c [Acidobacteriota bacterium]
DMTFYYTEPKAGNLWVFALDGARPVREQAGTNLVTLPGGLPRVGEPGATLGGRVLPGYGFPPTEGGEAVRPSPPAAPPELPAGEEANPLLGDDAAIAAGERIYRSACVGCHLAGPGAGENVFRSRLTHRRFFEVVAEGVEENNMPAFGELLSADEIWQVHAYLMSRDRP